MSYPIYCLSLVYAVFFLCAAAFSALRNNRVDNGLLYMFLFGTFGAVSTFLAPFEMRALDPGYGTVSTAELVVMPLLGILGGGPMMTLAVIYHRKLRRLGWYPAFAAMERRLG